MSSSKGVDDALRNGETPKALYGKAAGDVAAEARRIAAEVTADTNGRTPSRNSNERETKRPSSPGTPPQPGEDGENVIRAAHPGGGIFLCADEHEVVAMVTGALARARDASLYQRDGVIVAPSVLMDEPDATPAPTAKAGLKIRRPLKLATLAPASAALVRLCICEHCLLQKINEAEEIVQAHPPPWLVQGVMARPGPIPVIDGLLLGPTIGPDGRLINAPGYDAATRWFVARHLPGLALPDVASKQDAREAVAVIRGLVCDFPWASDADFARWLCLLLTACARHLSDKTPLGLINANTAGAGKTLLACLIAMIAYGLDSPIVTSWPEGTSMQGRDDEVRKRLASLLHEGATLVLLDNLPRGTPFTSPTLDAFLTTDSYHDRQLGRNDGARVGGLNRCLLLATGNNVAPTGDTADRTLLVTLCSTNANPRSRAAETFREPDIEGHVRENRAKYLGAALTIWRAWIQAGCPRPAGVAWGSFTAWTNIVPAMVRWADLPDPLGDRAKWIAESDGEGASLRTIAALWRPFFGDEPLMASDIIKRLDPEKLSADQRESEALREALLALAPTRNGQWPISSKSLGRVLTAFEKRVVEVQGEDGSSVNLQVFRTEDKHQKVFLYGVRDAISGGVRGLGGVSPVTRELFGQEEQGENTSTSDEPTPPTPPTPQDEDDAFEAFPPD